MFTILSWNILQGGGSRAMQLLQHIGDLKPTVCILSEFRNNDSGAAIRLGLLKHGYRHQFVTDAPRDENSVLIASLMACSNQIHPLSDPVFSGSILSVHFEVFSIMGVYLPHKKKHVLFDYILKHVQQVEKPYIIAGDFNSGLNRIDQEGSSFWYEDKLKALDAQGYKDAFRHKHLEAKEYSWYSHQGNGYRYDHTYMHESLLPVMQDCRYIHDWREARYSDHSPMLLLLG